MNGVVGFMYPNEYALQWSILIVLYPFITGLVAGAFILASLERVFRVEAVKPTYRLALLTALAFLLDAPLPLQLHLGHPERSPEMYFTPHATSAMAMFGYVYLWYLMAVLVFEIWLDYRRDIVILSQQSKGLLRVIYKIMTLGSSNISERSLRIDDKVGWIVTLIGIPSAFLLHGYVGFIFGSIKANPWWSSPLMPVVFIFSAMVSGVAAVMLLYMATTKLRKLAIDMHCVDTIAMYMFYIFIIDFSLEMLDLIHRIYEADESFRSLDFMVHTKLFFSQIVLQIILGTLVPLTLLFITQVWKNSLSAIVRKRIDQRLCHALECGDWRAALLQEFSRLHHLQDGAGDTRRLAGGDWLNHPAPALSVGAGEAAAAMARQEPAPASDWRLTVKPLLMTGEEP
jgi:Ni/Fe-hydrogenase subunit HybB-like protein